MTTKEDVLVLSYDFLKYLIPILSKFPRDQKFLLADRMQTLMHTPVLNHGLAVVCFE